MQDRIWTSKRERRMRIPGVFKNAGTVKEVPAGEVIFEAGTEGHEMFGVVEGEVELTMPNGVSTRVGPDGTFGEMALVDHSPRSATAVAVSDTKLAVINDKMFLFLVHETPMFALQVMGSLAERLRARG
jgi:CRP/FNR family transcriptional regulator, cyclic AMP receptor protein